MAKMSSKEARLHAKTMSAYAQEHLADGLDTWKGEADMIEMVRADCKDYRAIGKLLRENKVEKARDLAGSLDTAARECVPDSVWEAMEEHCFDDEEFEEVTKSYLDRLVSERDLLNVKIDKAIRKHAAAERRVQ